MYPDLGDLGIAKSDRDIAAPDRDAGQRLFDTERDHSHQCVPPAGTPPSSSAPLGATSSSYELSSDTNVVKRRNSRRINGAHSQFNLDDLPYGSWERLPLPQHSLYSHPPPYIVIVTQYVSSGRTYDVYAGTLTERHRPELPPRDVVIKLCNLDTFTEQPIHSDRARTSAGGPIPYTRAQADAAIRQEDRLYRVFLSERASGAIGNVVPQYFGTWCYGSLGMALLEDCGRYNSLQDVIHRYDLDVLHAATCAAYDALHDAGVLHNDIQARHILIHPAYGTIRLIDFEGAVACFDGADFDEARFDEGNDRVDEFLASLDAQIDSDDQSSQSS